MSQATEPGVSLIFFCKNEGLHLHCYGCFLFSIEPILIFVSKTLNLKHHDIGIRIICNTSYMCEQEIALLSQLSHPNIVQFYGSKLVRKLQSF